MTALDVKKNVLKPLWFILEVMGRGWKKEVMFYAENAMFTVV